MSAQVVNLSTYFDPEPTEQEKLLWDRFVEEYVKDYNPVEACIRVGFNLNFAVEYAKVFMTKPYVQKAIMAHKQAPVEEQDHLAKVKAMIESTLMECMQNGQPSTRVIAAKTLASIHGIDQSPNRAGEELDKLVDAFKKVAKNLPE